MFTNRLLCLGASAGALSLRGSGCRNLALPGVYEQASTLFPASYPTSLLQNLTHTSRKGLDQLMKAVRGGRVDVVLCYNLDHLGRSLSHLVQLLGEFAAHKIALIVPGQGINTSSSNPASALLLNMLGAIAQFEHSIIVERVNAGLAAARRRGIKLGRPGTLGVHREAVAKLRAQGRTGRAIAKELGIPSSSVFKLIAGL